MAALGALTSLSLAITACGGGEDKKGGAGGAGGGTVQGDTLTIYSSLPLQGASRAQSEAVNNGAKLALKKVNNKVGDFNIKYTELDDATAQAGKWDPGATSQNARKVLQDKTTIAVLGEFNSGASAISMPIYNKAGILQVSPSNTAVGLTTADPAEPGTPTKYYPTQKRHYARVVPRDSIQGPALVKAMTDEGCKGVDILNDKEVYGKGLALQVENAAKEQGLQVGGNEGIDIKAPNYRSQAGKFKSDCFFFGGLTDSNGVQVYKDVASAKPDVKLFGGDGVCESGMAEGLPADIAPKFLCTAPILPRDLLKAEGQKFFEDYEAEYKEKNPDPYGIYGYETMDLILDAIKSAGAKGNDRQAVIDAFLNIKDRDSVLGKYSIDENGDTTLSDYGANVVEDGKLVFNKVLKAQGAS